MLWMLNIVSCGSVRILYIKEGWWLMSRTSASGIMDETKFQMRLPNDLDG
jgi:hypothetical protein